MRLNPYFCASLLIFILASCKNYSVSLNNNVLYTPPSLFTDFTIKDTHLRSCIEQTIIDNRVTKAEELKQLNCSHAGIADIAGLEKFRSLEKLNLAENNLSNVIQLARMSELKVLILSKNNLTSAEPLLTLVKLKELDLSGNGKLECADAKQLLKNFQQDKLKATLPEHCQ